MMDQLKQELAKDVSDQIDAKIKAQPVVEMNEQKSEELVGREVCQQSSGFISSWLQCSMEFDKWYPKSRSNEVKSSVSSFHHPNPITKRVVPKRRSSLRLT